VQLRKTHCAKQQRTNNIIFFKQFQYSIIFLQVIFHPKIPNQKYADDGDLLLISTPFAAPVLDALMQHW
jgi:hypothetical protein